MRTPGSGLRIDSPSWPLTREELYELYWAKGMSASQIAQLYQLSNKTIWQRLKALNISVKEKPKLSSVTKEDLERLYVHDQLTTYQIAELYHVDPSSVWERMKVLGIPRRKTGGSKRGVRGKGHFRNTDGYVLVRLLPESLYYPMAAQSGYVLEHRLIIAQHLGRCLLPSEVVHHRNGIVDDNRLENLEVLGFSGEHTLRSVACSRCPLRKEIRLLRWQIKEQGVQINALTAKVLGVIQ